MPLSEGTRLGSYEILSPLGAGGMGEVYRARDTRLDRDVAIKILPQAFFADAERVARFQREAKVLASLNHPHIGAIYGLHDEGDGVRALVMELVEGEDLDQRVKRGALPLDEALPIASQIAQALEAAHERGIVHRDLKPANIKLRSDGTVKVLDFGLAKAAASDGETPDLADSPTVTAVATHAGTILGTASYMSPEQAKGRPVDRRADVWAFGAVLYELLTSTRAFRGESVAEVLSHVLTQAPDWTRLPAGTPASIRTLLRRCLEKNPARRLDSAAALRLEIGDALTAPAGVTDGDVAPARRRRISWTAIAAVVAASIVTALVTWAVTRNEPPAPDLPVRFTIVFPPTDPMNLDPWGRDLAMSPDGRYLAYLSRGRLMLRALDQLDAVNVSSATGVPFFSPDSRWVGFFDGGDLKKVAVTGQPVITLCRNLGSPQGGTWGDDGTIVIASMDRNIGLRRVPENGGEATELTRNDVPQQLHNAPSMLPGGRGVLFTIWTNAQDRHLAVLDLKSGQVKKLLPGAAAEYLDTGHLLYVTLSQRADQQLFGTVWVVAFDLERLAVLGESVRVSETLQVDVGDGVNFAVSKAGGLAYVPDRMSARSFVWVERTTGRETAIEKLPPRPYDTIALSPDDKRLAYTTHDREIDIWTWDLEREFETHLTSGPGVDTLPKWTRDGRIVYRSNSGGPGSHYNIYRVASDGSGVTERLTDSSNVQFPNSITRDDTILFVEFRPNTGFDILRRPLAAAQAAAVDLVSTPSHEYAANISPDGRYFAYISAGPDGRFDVYVRPYPDASNPVRITTEGGYGPVWARTGKELFYLDASNTLMAVPVDTSGPQFRTLGKPAKVFDTKYWGNFYSYDVAKDGRFLMMKETTDSDLNRARIVVVLNWFEELKRLLPAR